MEQKWVTTEIEFEHWLRELIGGSLAQQDLPLLRKLHLACMNADVSEFDYWSYMAVALRDTAELRAEERARGSAYLRILTALPDKIDNKYLAGMKRTPLAAIAWAATQWGIEKQSLLTSFAHNWLEAYVINGVKIIPLGQTHGQTLLHSLLPELCSAVNTACLVDDDNIGFSTPAISLASCAHESQYTRIYRS